MQTAGPCEKLAGKKRVRSLTVLLTATYFVSYLTRVNFGAVVAEMERATGFSRSLLSLSLTGSFVTYGIGQIVSGICGDRFQPKTLIACTYLGSAASTWGIARLSDTLGWRATLLVWAGIAAAGTGLCMLCAPHWKGFARQHPL